MDHKMTTKQCGNCKWWDLTEEFTNSFNDSVMSECSNELSDFHMVYKDWDVNCAVFEERKE